MSDVRKYSLKESANRILRLFQGKVPASNQPDQLTGKVLSVDEAIGDLAELMAGVLANESGTLPSDVTVPAASVKDGDTVWDDLRVPALSVKVPASGDPDFAEFRTNATGTSQGVFAYWFDAGSEEEVYFNAQMPHAWNGNPIHPHVHWSIAANSTGTVSWGLEYTWIGITGTFPGTQLIYGNSPTTGEDTLYQYRHYLTKFPVITGSNMGLSSMLICRLFRDATAVGLADTCPQDAGLHEIDFHFEIDTIGSDEEYTK
jgi:hypothetical protein